MKRPRPLHLALGAVAFLVIVLGVVIAVAMRSSAGPAPAPPGALASIDGARLALVEASLPPGEAGEVILNEADAARDSIVNGWPAEWRSAERVIANGAAYGPREDPRVAPSAVVHQAMRPAIELALGVADRPRGFESAQQALGAPAPLNAFDSSSWIASQIAPALEAWLHAELVQAMLADDGPRAGAALDALLRIASYYAQRPGFGSAHVAHGQALSALQCVIAGVRDGAMSPPTCEALISVIRSHAVWGAIESDRHIEGERLWAQRQALLLRSHFRSIGRAGRAKARAFNRLVGEDGFFEMPEAGWLRVLTKYDAGAIEAQIDAYYAAVEAWWRQPAASRAPAPRVAGPAGEGPWAVLPTLGWAGQRHKVDMQATRRAGVILLLRIEAYQHEHGEAPAALLDAASADEIIDPLVDRPFRYRRLGADEAGEWAYELLTGVTVEELVELGVFFDSDTLLAGEFAQDDASLAAKAAALRDAERRGATLITCGPRPLGEQAIIDLPWVDRQGRLIEGAAPRPSEEDG